MLKQKTNSRRGFTIIEVVLVLAIAGLIFLMVFLALPALQRSQRDTERRNKLGEFRTQVIQYQSNNRGRVPGSMSDWQRVVDNYMNLSMTTDGGLTYEEEDKEKIPFQDPTGEPYYIAYYCDLSAKDSAEVTGESAATLCTGSSVDSNGGVDTSDLNWNDNKYQIYAFKRARCDGETVAYQEKDSDRLVAFVVKLEGNGVYCGEN